MIASTADRLQSGIAALAWPVRLCTRTTLLEKASALEAFLEKQHNHRTGLGPKPTLAEYAYIGALGEDVEVQPQI